ncbi:MAG TPA: prephenate dehydratase [Blastocatellia bacterium]|jgi:prephenate dehydratase|nr:prephenate dehydratase [Blastocatellia bacterium]
MIRTKEANEITNPRVAFQGEPGAFSGEAARKLLGHEVELIPCETFEKMFAEVEDGSSDYCLAPIENSLFGSVHQNYDLLLKHSLRIVGETNLRIIHNLIAAPGTRLDDVKRVYSHPVALGQCRRFLTGRPEIRPVAAYDTAGSVKMIMESRESGAAAIASAAAAEVYGALILVPGIEDDQANFTRFLLLAREDACDEPPPGADKTSIVFSLENRMGSLYRAMAVFALRDIDLVKIESRPLIGRPWEYSFYLDFIGAQTEPRVRNAMAHLREFATSVKILGCYKSGVGNGEWGMGS